MGNKRKLAPWIIDTILQEQPNTKHFYDLFGGGGSVSFEALQRPNFESVHYNELNTGVVELLKKIHQEGVTKEFYQWVDRETFHTMKNADTWFGGLCKVVWSFGNNSEKGYLFSKENEALKKPLHELIVNKSLEAHEHFHKTYGLFIPYETFQTDKPIQERRLDVMAFVKKNKGRVDLERLQQLQQLEQLQQLQQLTLPDLHITNLSYDQVPTLHSKHNTVLYLDPPYKGTATYQETLDHDKLLQWILHHPYTIYVSSYAFPGLREVASKEHRCTLSATANGNKVQEKLFCNKEHP